MALEKVRTLSALTLHFATEDLTDREGNVIPKGSMKIAHLEFTTYISEDGVAIPGTARRETATVKDLDSIPEVRDKTAAALVGMAAQKHAADEKRADAEQALKDERKQWQAMAKELEKHA